MNIRHNVTRAGPCEDKDFDVHEEENNSEGLKET